ncbi:hypothetical protein DRQ32_06635 [bacterium]|nr:MAG: hypothetical protein DRQ32_06635 [bacterium]
MTLSHQPGRPTLHRCQFHPPGVHTMLTHNSLRILLPLILVAALVGCGDDNPTDSGAEAPGTLRMSLMDAPTPIEGVEALHLTVSAVRVNAAADADGDDDGGWYDILPDTLTVEERTFDLLLFANGESVILGEELLPAGHYEQIRLVIEESNVTVDGTVYDLKIPSGSTSGLKLIHGFDIHPDGFTALMLDFDVGRSLFATPPGSTNFKLKPVIRVVSEELAGRITGTVLPVDIDAMVMAVSAALEDTATAMVEPATGEYVIGALLAGSYDVTAMAPGYLNQTITDIGVIAGADTTGVDFTLSIDE